jgi:hypothetical protein
MSLPVGHTRAFPSKLNKAEVIYLEIAHDIDMIGEIIGELEELLG